MRQFLLWFRQHNEDPLIPKMLLRSNQHYILYEECLILKDHQVSMPNGQLENHFILVFAWRNLFSSYLDFMILRWSNHEYNWECLQIHIHRLASLYYNLIHNHFIQTSGLNHLRGLLLFSKSNLSILILLYHFHIFEFGI